MKFSLPSFDQIGAALLRMVKRFPFVVLVSVVGTVTALWLAGLPFSEQDSYPKVLALAFTCALGVSFQLGIATFLEQNQWGNASKYIIQAAGLLLLFLYWFLIGDQLMEGPHEVWYRYFLFFLASHLFVAFAPFTQKGNVDQFWEYNKSLFLRILLSVLYSGVLFVGLSIALLALDNLLELNIDGERYLQLFLFLVGIFNTWFFLTGVPEKEVIHSSITVFPKGLRVFVQFVLIPLVTVYIVILYLYLGKIILEWQLPNGWVSNLVLTFSIAGILSLLLLYPIRNSKGYNWIRIYSKGYYLALIPLIGLLMFSIWVRISEYGITVNRYFVATLGVWLTGIVIYFILSKAKSIKVIPVSLFLIAVAVSFGPLGAFAVSERSQLGRFEEILDNYGYLDEDGKVQKSETEIPFDERKELSSVAEYVVEAHSFEIFQKYFKKSLNEVIADTTISDSLNPVLNYRTDSQKILNEIGINYVSKWAVSGEEVSTDMYYEFSSSGKELFLISEYELVIPWFELWSGQKEVVFEYENEEWLLVNDIVNYKFILKQVLNQKIIEISYLNMKDELIKKYGYRKNEVPMTDMSIISENEEIKVLSLFSFLSGNTGISRMETTLYIKIKQ